MNLSFSIVNRDNNTKVEGTLIQFGNHTGSISFSHIVGGKKVHDINIAKKIEKPLIYIASFVQKQAEDKYSKVLTDSESIDIYTKAVELDVIESKLNLTTVFNVNGVFLKDLDQSIQTQNGSINLFDLLDIKDVQKVKIPADGMYSKSDFINKVLMHNCVSHDIDRKFVKVLHDEEQEIKKAVLKTGETWVSIKTYGKFSLGKAKFRSDKLILEIPKSVLA